MTTAYPASLPNQVSLPTNSASPTRIRFLVLAALGLAAAISYLSRNCISVAESTIREELTISERQMGWVMSVFFLVYALVQIPAGWVAQSWGSRRALPAFALFWSVATLLTSFAQGLPLLIAGRLLNGIFQAGLFSGCTSTIATWFPVQRRATANGALASSMSIGAAIAAALTGELLPTVGWRWTFALYSVMGVAWAIAFYVWFRDRPAEHAWVNPEEVELISPRTVGVGAASANAREATPWLALFTSPATWCICTQQFFRAAGYIFFSSWFATYLQATRGVSITKSGWLTALPLLSVVVGSLLGGMISDAILIRTGSRVLARKGLAMVMLGSCAALIFLAYFLQDPLAAVLVISGGMLCFAVAGPPAYTITIDMGGKHVATLFSTMNMCGNLGAAAFPYIVPWFRESMGSWDSVLLLFGGMFVLASGCWFLLNPQGTIFEQAWYGRPNESNLPQEPVS